MRFSIAILLSLLLFPAPSFSGPFEDGQMAFDHGDHQSAFNLWKPLAEQGNIEAQNKIGWMYESAYGVAKDEKEAMKWYLKAAEQGNAEAQVNIGLMYRDGKGVERDKKEAAKWYRKAADQGDPAAFITLGEMYENGEGVERDYAEALFWISLTAKVGLDDGTMSNTAHAAFAKHLSAEQVKAVDQRIQEWKPAKAAAPKEEME